MMAQHICSDLWGGLAQGLDVKERNSLPRFAGGCIVRPIFPTLA